LIGKQLAQNWNGVIAEPNDISSHIHEDTVPIVLCANDKYFINMLGTVSSIIYTSNKFRKYHIIVLERNFTEDMVRKIKNIVENNTNFFFSIFNMNYTLSNVPLKVHQYSIDVFHRFLIPYWFKRYKKVIYLDSDTIVRDDIANLYDIDIDCRYSIMACKFDLEIFTKDWKPSILSDTISKNITKWINSGVLVFNTETFVNHITLSELLKLAIYTSNTFVEKSLPDEEPLNIIFSEHCQEMPFIWNNPRSDDYIKISHYASPQNKQSPEYVTYLQDMKNKYF
jgi:lipopolysaccharide biosynthesis glycosyltransferase